MRISAWNGKLLNRVGKICLAKPVISFIPIYSMQPYWLPKSTLDLIDQLCRRFIWANDGVSRGWCMVSWKELIKPKDHEGVGLRDSHLANISLLGKMIWQLIHFKINLGFLF